MYAAIIDVIRDNVIAEIPTVPCQRPYHVEYTASRPLIEVKQR